MSQQRISTVRKQDENVVVVVVCPDRVPEQVKSYGTAASAFECELFHFPESVKQEVCLTMQQEQPVAFRYFCTRI